jgi:hypothetical protein
MKIAYSSLLWSSLILAACGPKTGGELGNLGQAVKPTLKVAQIEDALAEKEHRPSYLSMAAAVATAPVAGRYPWPVQVKSIGHNTASYQNYGGEPYFHHGLDIRADAGTDVLASVGGQVVNISNYGPGPAYWEVAILDSAGYVWQYHHVDRDSIPQAIWDAFRSKAPIPAGTKIGEVYYWMVSTYGEVYHHVHLNVLARGGAYRNPFNFLESLNDTKAPEFVDVGLMRNGYPQDPSLPIQGAYGIYATIHDLILHDKFVVPPHKITYQLDDDSRERVVWDFSELPGGSSNTQYVENFFVPELTCGNYECRKLTVNIGFSTEGQRWFSNVGGEHSITIHAEDHAGNRTSKNFKWQVRQPPAP